MYDKMFDGRSIVVTTTTTVSAVYAGAICCGKPHCGEVFTAARLSGMALKEDGHTSMSNVSAGDTESLHIRFTCPKCGSDVIAVAPLTLEEGPGLRR